MNYTHIYVYSMVLWFLERLFLPGMKSQTNYSGQDNLGSHFFSPKEFFSWNLILCRDV